MDDEAQLFERIAALLVDQMRPGPLPITMDTRLAEDLGMAGDDADEFFDAFRQTFEVDCSDLDLGACFGPEAGWSPIATLISLFVRHHPPTVRVSDLVRAAKSHRWEGP
jgi:acyl carrier protein